MQLREIPGFGTLVDGLTGLIGHFDNKDLAFLIALAILIGALGLFLFLFLRRHRPWLLPVRRVTKELRSLMGTAMSAEQRLNQASVQFAASPSLLPLWRDYRAQLRPTPAAAGYHNLIDPRVWFSVDALPGRGYEQWASTLAGVFLTVGLLFTFVGLSAALLKIVDAGGDPSKLWTAIMGILNVSSAKFITSIAGLVAYIGFSLVTRHWQSQQQAAALALADAVAHLSVPLTPEWLLYEQVEIGKRQLLRLDRLSDDLAIAIDARLQQRLAELSGAFGTHLEDIKTALPAATADPIVTAINGIGDGIAQSNAAGLEGMLARVGELAEKLGTVKDGMGGMGENFGKQIGDAAAELKAAAEEVQKGLQSGSQGLNAQIEASSQRLEAVVGALTGVPGGIDDAFRVTLQQLAATVDGLRASLTEGGQQGADALRNSGIEAGQKFGTQIEGAAAVFKIAASEIEDGLQTGCRKLTEEIGASGGKLRAIAEAFDKVPEGIDRGLEATLNKLVQAADDLSTRLSNGGDAGAQAIEQGATKAGQGLRKAVKDAGSEFEQTLNAATGKLNNTIADLANRLATVEEALTALPDAVKAQVENLQAAGSSFQSSAQAVSASSLAMQNAAGPVQAGLSAVNDSLTKVRAALADANHTQEQTREAAEQALSGLKQAATAAEKTFRTHVERFGQADQDLATALDNLRKGVTQVAEESKKLFAGYDNYISKAVASLASAAELLADAVETKAAQA